MHELIDNAPRLGVWKKFPKFSTHLKLYQSGSHWYRDLEEKPVEQDELEKYIAQGPYDYTRIIHGERYDGMFSAFSAEQNLSSLAGRFRFQAMSLMDTQMDWLSLWRKGAA